MCINREDLMSMYIGVEDNQHQVFSLSASPPYFLRQGFSFALDLTN